jgi:L-aspartate oxidase
VTGERTDCLVIGAGAAGAVYAVQAAQAGLQVTLITGAAELHASNSLWAQGGIIYDVHDHGDGDLLRADIDAASGHSANPTAVDAIVRDGPRLVRELLLDDLRVGFDRDAAGELKFTREASHSRPRIIYAKDHTGRAILTALHQRLGELAAAGTLPGGGSLTVATGCFAVDLLTLSHSSVDFLDRYRPLSCIGAYVLDVAAGEVRPIVARKTVLATGGLGQLYLHSTNDTGAYGHGVAMAYRVGARVIDMEYVQFHPTVFHRRGERPFLISEAVRGEGGVLINHGGEAFMERYHPDGSLAPRDVISRSIHSELLRGASDTVYIDLSGVDADYARRRFPTIHARLLAAGVDMAREPIPVVPAAHYSCGGIHTDMAGDTNIAHLSAIGETACTGLHGANRLASTSLLECVVMGANAARRHATEIAAGGDFHLPQVRPWVMASAEPDEELITQDLRVIRNTMWNYVGLVRTAKRLDRAGNLLRELKSEIDGFYADNALTPRLLALRNAVQNALLITYAALRNPRSAGCHYRNDSLDRTRLRP